MKQRIRMTPVPHWRTITRQLALATTALCLSLQTHAVILIGPSGSGTLTFDAAPAAAEFTTGVMNGTGPTYENVTALDSGVAAINAANIFDALPTVAEATPSTFAGGFRFNSTLARLSSRPTTGGTNACSVLLAKIQNDTGATAYSMSIAYDFALYSAAAGALPGYYVYYSQTGEPNSWVRIGGLSGSEAAGLHSADVDLSAAPWPAGGAGYVLWVDDNADGVSDPGYTIDNLVFQMGPLNPIVITQQPVGTNVTVFRPFSLSVQATGTGPHYQWYHDTAEILDATNATYSVASAQETDTGDYYVLVSNPGGSVPSDTVHVEVNTDDVPPAVLQAVGSATFNEVTIQFSEKINPASLSDPVNFVLDPGGLIPTSMFLTNADTVVVLTFPQPYNLDLDYTLTMYGVTDLANNPIPDATTATFHSWVPNALGGVVFQVYTNLSTTDNAIGQLTNSAKFPYAPDETYIINGLNTRGGYPDDTHEGYGGRMWTLFVPLATGKYRFFTYSDDSSYIYLNPAGPDPAGATLIAYEASCCNPFTEPAVGMTRTSEPIDLVAGQGYYIEGIYKEGTGGDYLYVGARMEGDPTPASGLTNIMSSAAAAPALPAGLVGPAVITQQPASAQVEQPARATFTVVAGSTPVGPLLYQWQKSDDAGGSWVNIPGAAGPSYTTPPTLALDDDQDQYRVVVTSPIAPAISDPATLTVAGDTTGPTMVSAQRLANLTTILVTFSEPMAPEMAGDPVNYSVCNTFNASDCLGFISTVTLTNNDTQAYLETPIPNPNTIYRVGVVPEMTDAWGNAIQYPDFAIVGVGATFQQGDANGYAGTTDAHVRSDEATTAHDLAIILVDNLSPLSHGLLKFDNFVGPNPGQVPPGSIISSASLRIYTINWGNPIRLHRMLVPWTEASTWNDVGNANDGVSLTAGDAVTNAEATYTTAAVDGGVNEWRQIDVTASVLFWATNSAANYGWALMDSGDDGYQGASSEATDQTLRPQLIINYTPSSVTNPIVIVTQPVVTNVINESESVTLSVVVTGTEPSYQWYKDDAVIPTATSASYTITGAVESDSGKYYCRITNLAGSQQSDDSWLTVIADHTAPAVVSAKGGPATNITVVVTFSEPMAVDLAQTTSNYEVVGPGNLTVLSAAASGATVTLTLSGPRQATVIYNLVVRDLLDAAVTPNLLAPNPTTVPIATLVEVVSINTQIWKYLQQTVAGEPAPCLDGTTWTEPGYDDAAWQSGYGVFYGNRDPANQPTTQDGSAVSTYLNVFTNAANAIQQTNYYFRTTFTLPSEVTNGASLLYHCMADDGAVFYLNGNRVGNLGYSTDPASCAGFATRSVNPLWDPALASLGRALELTGLVPGVNTLAVQVGQVNATSSDIGFGLLLEAEVINLITPLSLRYVYDPVAQTITFSWDGDATLEVADEVVPQSWGSVGATSPQVISTTTGNKFYRLRQP